MPDSYTGQHFFAEVDMLNDQLEESVDEMRIAGREMAQAERDYRVALAKKIWDLRTSGIPVTIINDLARGDEEVAMLKLKRDASETDWKTCIEVVNTTKLKVRVIAEQIGREWGRPSNVQ